MIEWFIDPVSVSFEIETHYFHPLPGDGSYSFLYAMGTGRYLESYAKETTAYVSVNVSKVLAAAERCLNLHTLRYDVRTKEWLWNPVDCMINQNGDFWLIALTKASAPFQPLVEDLLVTINPSANASLTQDSLELTTHIDKTSIMTGETVDIFLTMANRGNDTVEMVFKSSQTFDIFLVGADVVSIWSYGRYFTAIYLEVPLKPNQTFSQSLQWNFFLYNPSVGEFVALPPGEYVLVGACVGFPFSLTDLANSLRSQSGLRIELVLPDVNHDRRVDIIDVASAVRAFGSKLGDTRWNVDADVQGDGIVNILDMSIIARSFGKSAQAS
jgi:hypothetical protein